jgi:hypothetical protein
MKCDKRYLSNMNPASSPSHRTGFLSHSCFFIATSVSSGASFTNARDKRKGGFNMSPVSSPSYRKGLSTNSCNTRAASGFALDKRDTWVYLHPELLWREPESLLMLPHWSLEFFVHSHRYIYPYTQEGKLKFVCIVPTSSTGTRHPLQDTALVSQAIRASQSQYYTSYTRNEKHEFTYMIPNLLNGNPKSSPSHRTSLLTHSCSLIATSHFSPAKGYLSLVYMVRNLFDVS